jgi:branched-subunit amino acid transport protein
MFTLVVYSIQEEAKSWPLREISRVALPATLPGVVHWVVPCLLTACTITLLSMRQIAEEVTWTTGTCTDTTVPPPIIAADGCTVPGMIVLWYV